MKLEKFNYSNGSKKKYFLYGFIMCAVLMVLVNLFTSHAKYKVTQSIKLAEGKISYKPYDFKIMAMYQENNSGTYEEIEKMPSSGYAINEEQSYCTIDNKNKDTEAILKTNSNGEHIFSNLSKTDKCYVWFDKKLAKNQILANMPTQTTRTDFSQVVATDNKGTIYKADDDDGLSYYYAGAASDNWVKFGKNKDKQDMYWRIIRINGDNTIRMIHAGTSSSTTTGTGTQTTKSAFNSSYNNNMYVGYMYTSGQVHGFESSSTVKEVLDGWYDQNLASYASYIDTNAGFCGDRGSSTTNGGAPNGTGGTGTTATYYAAGYRLNSNKTPDFKCADANDLYTPTSSGKGNTKLAKFIGLISADEVAYAGGVYGTNNSGYYLYTGQNYWTMSPSWFNGSSNNAWTFVVNYNGFLNGNRVEDANGVRPVINLRADVKLTGTGTSSDPYIVVGAE